MTTFEAYIERKMKDPRFRREYEGRKLNIQTREQIGKEALRYVRAKSFLDELAKAKDWIGSRDYFRLRRQALSGDVAGAGSELNKLENQRMKEAKKA